MISDVNYYQEVARVIPMKLRERKEKIEKSLIVKILQWLYLIISAFSVTFFFWYKKVNFLPKFDLPNEFLLALSLVLGFYCLILAVSYFTQNSNLLILALVLLFFTTIIAILMFAVTIPNAKIILSGNLPFCINNLSACNVQDGIVVASAWSMAVSVPILILNFISIIGAVKAIAATD